MEDKIYVVIYSQIKADEKSLEQVMLNVYYYSNCIDDCFDFLENVYKNMILDTNKIVDFKKIEQKRINYIEYYDKENDKKKNFLYICEAKDLFNFNEGGKIK